ncbi:actin-related protein 8-like [Adelges cooleyi]|uniref:actin-related protein 8-like n=1 Tax=Adelges cooleyi TaxID=133065 RepID=UPI00218049AC|nr:actin-related protein 8-like [Adelges cooleyi]
MQSKEHAVRIEGMEPSSVIIIHPGSMNLRIGRATDKIPFTVIHGIARKKIAVRDTIHNPILQCLPTRNVKTLAAMETSRRKASQMLRSSFMSNGERRLEYSEVMVARRNNNSRPIFLNYEPENFVEPTGDTVFGEEMFKINPKYAYDIFFPIVNGRFNDDSCGFRRSFEDTLCDLEDIWTHHINQLLDISTADFKNYRVVLIIPDLFDLYYTKEVMSMVLLKMNFKACFLIQDHVAAAICAGNMGNACVVDVGHKKTSISCVADYISQPNTRIRYKYGGVQKLKEQYCHLNLDTSGCTTGTMMIKNPIRPVIQYQIQIGDEAMIAPLGMFDPTLMAIDMDDRNYVVREEPELHGSYDNSFLFDRELQKPQGLDKVIVQSIERMNSEDLKQKMYGNILLVGGGFKFPSACTWLKNKILLYANQIDYDGDVQVINSPGGLDPQIVTWKGAAWAGILERYSNNWVTREEWTTGSVQILKERAMFNW